MEKRALAAIALSIAVLFAFRYIEERRMGETARKRPPLRPVQTDPALPPAPAPAPAREVRPAPTVQPEAEAIVGDTVAPARMIVVENELYRAEIDSRGGALTSWKLKQYKTRRGESFEMVQAGSGGSSRPFPGSLALDEATLNDVVNSQPYVVETLGRETARGVYSAPATVSLTLRRGPLSVRKTYVFATTNCLVDLGVSVERNGQPLTGRLVLGQDLGPESEHLLNPSSVLQAVSNQAGKVVREQPPKDENEVKRLAGDIRWVGLDMQYFALIAVPKGGVTAFEIQRRPTKTVGLKGEEVERNLLRVTIPGNGSWQALVYLGAKQQAALEAVNGTDLSAVIDYGMFSFLVRPLLISLRYLERFVHNYGIAIIVLTLLLTLLLFPFRLKQMLSMKKMAVVQPRIKAIQEKYKKYKKTDPKRAEMNQEIMAAYKEHNVNPLGGCLPLLLQMPLLFAFYSLLASSIELRQAPFVAWIQDLSVKDPYYILPIVMGVTMFISQKMTPMTPGADPTQAKMMMFMPVVFTVMFLNVSSGLNLYFLCSNIFQIGFQKIAERWIGDQGAGAKVRS